MTSMTADSERAYHCLVSHLDNPMFIVTVARGEDRAGCLVGFATQCSIKPARWYVGISKANRTYELAATAELVVVHALGQANGELATLFGAESGDEVDKFARCEWRPGLDGRTPVLVDCPRWFAGAVVDLLDPGDHQGLVLEPLTAICADHGPQLGFHAVQNLTPGHPA